MMPIVKTSVVLPVGLYKQSGEIAEMYFVNRNNLYIEAIREGLRDYISFSKTYPGACRPGYLEKHEGERNADGETCTATVNVPFGLAQKMLEYDATPFAPFFRIWLTVYLRHGKEFWEGEE